MKLQKTMLVFVTLILLWALAACTSPAATVTVAPAAGLDGKTLLEQRCTICHSLDRTTTKKLNGSGWSAIVQRMVGKGAKINAAEQKTLIEYLSNTYGQ